MKDYDEIIEYLGRFETIKGLVDPEILKARAEELTSRQQSPEVFREPNVAKKIGAELREINDCLSAFVKARDFLSVAVEAHEKGEFDEIVGLISEEESEFLKNLEFLELYVLFNGEFDENDCLVEIHSGAGGEDAQDWAEMLAGMYIKFADSHDYSVEILEATAGDGAGIKSETIKIVGAKAYGKLKHETGVHRLVRISPFDSNARRHTSFASVLVTPVVNDSGEIEIRPEDLKIDTYRSSGAGGQHVNKTESAVRITHIPTGVVVACQNERSQIQNREQAMKMLYSKLTALKELEKSAEKESARKSQKKIEWGSQIRSYVFAPYTQVKDLRTGAVNTNVNKVMAGDLDLFITESLKYFNS